MPTRLKLIQLLFIIQYQGAILSDAGSILLVK